MFPTVVMGHQLKLTFFAAMSASPSKADIGPDMAHVCFGPILLQKSKVAPVRIFGETLKREAIDDSDNLSRATEVAYEFSVRQ